MYERMIVVNLTKGSNGRGIKEKLTNIDSVFRTDNDGSYRFDAKAQVVVDKVLKAGEHASLLALAVCGTWDDDKMLIQELIVSDARIWQNDEGAYLSVRNSTIITDKVVVADVSSYLLIDEQKFNRENGFCRLETSRPLIEKVLYYLRPLKTKSSEADDGDMRHLSCSGGAGLSSTLKEYAQSDPIAPAGCMKHIGRTQFALDCDKIIHSKAFRRMVDKAQVFSSSKGDHYRTRMTHTQEVVQISRAIAHSLEISESLSEAIALAHDVGHTPFGHQGERSLNECLKNLDSQIGNNYAYGGFKHNAQSVRVLSYLENFDDEMRGLDVSWQVLEGALWHTKAPLINEERESASDDAYLRGSIFYPKGITSTENEDWSDKIFHRNRFATNERYSLTLEGQVVAIADEIAQRSHDVDDALSANLLTISELLGFCEIHCADKFFQGLKSVLNPDVGRKDNMGLYVDRARLEQNLITSYIRDYFIDDVIETSLHEGLDGISKEEEKQKIFTSRHILMSEEAQQVCSLLERVVGNLVITSSEVAEFDARANRVVKGLFDAFLENPKLLPKKSLRRLAMLERLSFLLDAPEMQSVVMVDLSCCSAGSANDELKRIKMAQVTSYPRRGEEDWQNKVKKMLLVRTIVDYISGMTDSFALCEYHRVLN